MDDYVSKRVSSEKLEAVLDVRYGRRAAGHHPRVPPDLEASAPDPGGWLRAADQERPGWASTRRRHDVWRRLRVVGVLSWACGGGDGYGAYAGIRVRRGDGGGDGYLYEHLREAASWRRDGEPAGPKGISAPLV